MKYKRKVKTNTVEAYQVTMDNVILEDHNKKIIIANTGDWVITEVNGDIYVLTNEEFQKKFNSTPISNRQLLFD